MNDQGVNIPMENGSYVEALSTAAERAAFALDIMPSLITQVVRENRWQHRWDRVLQREVTFDTFEAFVTAKAPAGLGSSLDIIRTICAHDTAAMDAINQALAVGEATP